MPSSADRDNPLSVPVAKCSLENPDGRHFCQLHHDEESLVAAIGRFTLAGLQAGERVFLLLSESRRQKVFDHLRRHGIDPETGVVSERLVVTGTKEFRDTFLQNGVLDESAYRDSFNAIFDLTGRGERLRLYGEVSNELWHEGDVDTAVRLDALCNDILAGRRVAVFCGYLFDAFERSSYRPELEHVCRAHSCFPETQEDHRMREAVDEVSREVLGTPLSVALTYSKTDRANAVARLPMARRTIMWLQANMPGAMIRVLERARQRYR